METNRFLLCYYLSASVLSGEIEHGCVLIQSKMRKWFPMHTLLWVSDFFFFCRNEAAQILARQPWTMANMGWCALTVQKTDMTSKRKGVGKFSIKWREEQRKWKWREKGNVWQINLKKEPRVWAPSIPPCPHYSPGVDVCPFNLLNPLRDWSSLSFPLQNEINLKHAFRFHL